MNKSVLRFEKVKVKNEQSYDVEVIDAMGKKYILFPSEEREIVRLVREKKHGKSNLI